MKVPSGVNLLNDPFSNIPTKVLIKGSKPAARDGHTCNLVEVNNNKNYMVIFGGDILISRELSQDEIDSIKDFLEGQCSDGWGETYEQTSQDKEEVNGLNFYVNIKTWWGDGYPEWYLDIK